MVFKRFKSSSTRRKEKKRVMDHDYKSSKENIMNSDESTAKESHRNNYSKAVSESETDAVYNSPKSKTRSEERRRSSRERRLIYGTFNQSAITDVYLGMSSTKFDVDDNDDNHRGRRHRKSSSSSPKAERRILPSPVLKSRRARRTKRSIAEITGNETPMPENSVSPTKEDEQPHPNDDMYTRIKRQRRASQRITCGDFVETDLPGRRSSRQSTAKPAETNEYPRRSLRRRKARLGSEEREAERETPEDVEGKDVVKEAAEGENTNEDGGNDNGEDGEEEEEEEEEETSESSEEEAPRKYSLRERRAPPTHFQHELRESRFRRCRMRNLLGERSHSSNRDRRARRPRSRMRRSRALNRGSSSTSSSSSSSNSDDGPSADEARFQRRKAKSMMRARQRCRPMNFTEEDLKGNTVLRDRSMIGASLADVDPMTVDKNATFESIGGLDTVVRSLKEMVLFPLMYSEVFDKFKVAPPRGVLFHGPPGTGKTLVARALANECSPEGGRKVAFFMRKGADCLSKWVGESERQLRLLFNEAYTMRPSIIFFDEIDGLAPVRSTRQDQIHSSIVSTLLALLDGLDSRGEVVVIGATNRLDAIDPALRRPGRFDREFHFPLPRETARQQILKIHTSEWPNPPSGNLLDRLAKATSGYCGADLKALCTEAVLSGLRRRYPQVYLSKAKLQLDTSEIEVCETDFQVAMESIVAAGARVESAPSRPLSDIITPLVKDTLEGIVERVRMEFPAAAQTLRQQVAGEDDADDHLISEDAVDENGQGQSWSRLILGARGPQLLRRPRLLLLPGEEDRLTDQSWEERLSLDGGQGAVSSESSVLDQHLLPALFHRLEGINVFTVDSPSLFNVSARTPEESLSQLWREALRLAPSIIYVPRIDELLASLPETVTHCLVCLMQSGDPTARVFILATAAGQVMHPRVAHFFHGCSHRFVTRPSRAGRRLFFQDLFLKWPLVAPPLRRVAAQRVLEVLPVAQEASDVVQRRLNSRETELLFEKEEYIMRQMRLFLRDVLSKLQKDRRFSIFARPVDPEEVLDYYDIIKKPMDLSTIAHKINTHKYESVKDFLDDIDLICSNALEYNPDTTPADRELRNRACCLKDLAHAISKLDDHDDFNEKCVYVSNSRRRRGLTSNCSLPNFYHTKPREPQPPALEPAVTPSAAAPPPPPPTAPPTAPAAPAVTPAIKVSTDVPNKVAPASAPSKINTNIEALPSTPFGSIPRSATGHRLSRRLQHLAPEVVNSDVKERRQSKRNSDEPPSNKSSSHRDVSSLGLSFDEEHNTAEKPAARSGSECANSPPALSPVFSWSGQAKAGAALREAMREAEEAEKAHEKESGAANHPGRTRQASHAESKGQGSAQTTRSNGGKKNEKLTPVVPRLTRALTASNKLAEKAVSILEQPVPDLIVPSAELSTLLDRCVESTEGWSVNCLESIYSRLAARLLSYERVWDRTRLSAEYREVLVEFGI